MSRRKQILLGGAHSVPRKIVCVDDEPYFVNPTKKYMKERKRLVKKKPVRCPDCGKLFSTQQAFRLHQKKEKKMCQ